jgi:hypothetical protein
MNESFDMRIIEMRERAMLTDRLFSVVAIHLLMRNGTNHSLFRAWGKDGIGTSLYK